MESAISQAFQEELTCFICSSYFTDPVTISCGHSFCRACLHLSWEDIKVLVHCPICWEPSQQKDLRTNIVLKKLVTIARQDSLKKSLCSKEHTCVTHKETKSIFCMENRIYLCKLCSESHEHCAHTHCPIEAAAEGQMVSETWGQWESCRGRLSRPQQDGCPDYEEAAVFRMLEHLTQREDMIRTEYQKWNPVPCGEEKQHIEKMKNEGQCALKNLRERKSIILQNSMELSEIYKKLMVLSQKPYMELLQGFDDILQRSEPMQLNMPQAMKPELSALPITGLSELFQSFQGQVFFPEQNAITWKTTLLNYMRRISFRPHLQGPSVDIPECYTVFCGSKCSISGKYYWEVVVKDSLDWVVGVCIDSSFGKENRCVGCKLLLLACVKEGNHCNLLTSWPVIHLYIQKPVDRVGVLLDCDDGSLSFLDVARSSLIYKFPSGTINFPVQPFFCTDKTI
ncbi:tripartite motif-containing protein 43B-like [Cricetulus griseus]|uniref:Tripartite motif-containing protein 43B-like n=1 Tax=Cricetulus griseus TaxID=10029 RepID=A0A9J7HEZ0_CRIGR|nr:tripartite motif-containing protein 43B-like [Cricetulus griseus]